MMNQQSPSPFLEVEIKPSDLISLGSYWKGQLAALSPLERPVNGTADRFDNPTLFDINGSLHPHLQPVIEVLRHPQAAAGITNITGGSLIDWIVYYAANGQAAALSHVGESFWLQQPPPIPIVVEQLRQLLLPSGGLDQLNWHLTRTEAWVVWAVVDLLYQQEVEHSRFSLSDLADVLDLPLQGVHLLAAHFRDSLQLPLPVRDELMAACSSLVEKGLIGRMGTDYLAGDEFIELARQATSIHWYTTLRVSSEPLPGEVATFEIWLMQWDSGGCLAWYAVDDTVVILERQPEQLVNMVESALLQPGAYFNTPQRDNPVASSVQSLKPAQATSSTRKSRWPLIIVILASLPIVCCLASLLIGTLTGYINWSGI